MDKSIKEAFIQESRNEITRRIKSCESILSKFDEELPKEFKKKDMHWIYMIGAIILTIVFLVGCLLFSGTISETYLIPKGLVYIAFISFAGYGFTGFLRFAKLIKQNKKCELYKASIDDMITDLNNNLKSIDSTAEDIEECFKNGKMFNPLEERKTDVDIERLSEEGMAFFYQAKGFFKDLNAVMCVVSAICFGVACNYYFMLDGHMGNVGVVVALINIVLVIVANVFVYRQFDGLNFLSFIAGVASPFVALLLCFGVAIAAVIAFVGLLIVGLFYILAAILGW